MSYSIDQAFVKQFEGEVHTAYQRKGSKFRALVRTKMITGAKDTTFQKVGTGTASTKARHGLVPVMNVDHTNVTVTLADYYAGDWVDKLDELKTNIDERRVLADAGAYALGRTTDALIVTALSGATNTTAITLTSGATIRNSFLTATEEMANRDVPDDGGRYAMISPHTMSVLMTVKEFASQDYVDVDLPFIGRKRVRDWLGYNWFEHSGLPKSSNTRTNFLWHRNAVGHAIGMDVQTEITYHGDRVAHFVNSMMSMGAVLIDNNGVQKLTIDESAALPTS